MDYEYPLKEADEQTKILVWVKGKQVPNMNPAEWRHDIYGKLMQYSKHGNTNSDYGWEIDHIIPTAKGGSDALANLQPLQWRSNRAKGDD